MRHGTGDKDKVRAEIRQAGRMRTKLERRVGGFELKLNELEGYNEKLVAMIGGLRKQNEPHRSAQKQMSAALDKLAFEMGQQKQATHKALDERERCVDQLRHVSEDSGRDAEEFEIQVHRLKADAEEFDKRNRELERVLEEKAEKVKRSQCSSMRTQRIERERLEVKYGYLRSQLEGVDNDFRELERIVDVLFVPGQPEKLQQIIDKFVEKERRVASLQKFWGIQNDEIEALTLDLAALARQEAAQQQLNDEAAANPARGDSSKAAVLDEATLEKKLERFESMCSTIKLMFERARCADEVSGAHLATKGCSSSTIIDFMSAIASKIDAANGAAVAVREAAAGSRITASRKPNETLNAFLTARSAPVAEAPAPAPASAVASGSSDKPPPKPSPMEANALARKALKDDLPSMNDQGPEADGDAEPAESRRKREREAKKGAIDREKRDQVILQWVQRQQEVREAKHPTIRDYYYEDGDLDSPRIGYPPASART